VPTHHDQKWNLGHMMNSVYSSAICKKVQIIVIGDFDGVSAYSQLF
jgi:hypothetical protein